VLLSSGVMRVLLRLSVSNITMLPDCVTGIVTPL